MDITWESYTKAGHKYFNWLASTHISCPSYEPQADPTWSHFSNLPASFHQDGQGNWQGCFLFVHGFGTWSRQETRWCTYSKHERHLLRLVPESTPTYQDLRFATTCPNLDVLLKLACHVIHPRWVLVRNFRATTWGSARNLCLIQRSNWRKQISLWPYYCLHSFGIRSIDTPLLKAKVE